MSMHVKCFSCHFWDASAMYTAALQGTKLVDILTALNYTDKFIVMQKMEECSSASK